MTQQVGCSFERSHVAFWKPPVQILEGQEICGSVGEDLEEVDRTR